MTSEKPTVLVIGATGPTRRRIMDDFQHHPPFCRRRSRNAGGCLAVAVAFTFLTAPLAAGDPPAAPILVPSASRADYSGRDANATLMNAGLLTMKTGQPMELSKRYWRDAHGLIAARIPGQQQYWQHHLGPPDAGLWPRLPGIEYDIPKEDVFHGFSEGTATSEQDRKLFGSRPAISLIAEDEQNLFDRTWIYSSKLGGSRTYVDGIADGEPNGKVEFPKLFVFLKRRDGVEAAQFVKYLTEQFAPTLSKDPSLLKLRLHVLEPFDGAAWKAPKVGHDRPKEKQYHAYFEIAFRDRIEMRKFFDGDLYSATGREQAKFIGAMHVFPEEEIYTLVYGGKTTLAGLKGYAVSRTVREIGATNQLSPEMMEFIHGRK